MALLKEDTKGWWKSFVIAVVAIYTQVNNVKAKDYILGARKCMSQWEATCKPGNSATALGGRLLLHMGPDASVQGGYTR